MILTKPIDADSLEIGGGSSRFCSCDTTCSASSTKNGSKHHVKYASILQMNEISIGLVLDGNTGGEIIQVVENDPIERRRRNKYDVF